MLMLNDFQPFKFDNLIRRGATHDGGYLVPANLISSMLISLGLGDNWQFEIDMLKNKQIKKFIVFDHTVSMPSLIKSSIKLNRKLPARFYRLIVLFRYIRDFIFFSNLHVKKKVTSKGNGENLEISLTRIFENYLSDIDSSIVLKIDIEGYEYEIIEQISSENQRIALLIVEFHQIHARRSEFKKALDLIKADFILIHTHYNNFGLVDDDLIPDVCEFTFITRDLFKENSRVEFLPHPTLDFPSAPNRPDYFVKFDLI